MCNSRRTMKLDNTGYYGKHNQDMQDADITHCENCQEKFKEQQKVYTVITSEDLPNKIKFYCKECKTKHRTAEEL